MGQDLTWNKKYLHSILLNRLAGKISRFHFPCTWWFRCHLTCFSKFPVNWSLQIRWNLFLFYFFLAFVIKIKSNDFYVMKKMVEFLYRRINYKIGWHFIWYKPNSLSIKSNTNNLFVSIYYARTTNWD